MTWILKVVLSLVLEHASSAPRRHGGRGRHHGGYYNSYSYSRPTYGYNSYSRPSNNNNYFNTVLPLKVIFFFQKWNDVLISVTFQVAGGVGLAAGFGLSQVLGK